MRSKDILRSSRKEFLRRRIKSLALKSVFAVFILSAVLALFSWGLRHEKFLIKSVRIEGNETVLAEEISKIVEKNISGKYLFLFPKNNILIYPGGAVSKEILDNIKKINSVETKITDDKELLVRVAERKPAYVWCPQGAAESGAASENQCYFLDENGFSFSEAPRFSGPVFFEIYAGNVSDTAVGGYPFENSLFRKLTVFKNALAEMSLPAIRLIRMKDGDFSFELKDGGAILINEKNDINISLRNLLSVKKALNENGKATSSLEYIDLRFGNKVFYK